MEEDLEGWKSEEDRAFIAPNHGYTDTPFDDWFKEYRDCYGETPTYDDLESFAPVRVIKLLDAQMRRAGFLKYGFSDEETFNLLSMP